MKDTAPELCFLCGENDPDHTADWLNGEWVHKDCERESQRDEERRINNRGLLVNFRAAKGGE